MDQGAMPPKRPPFRAPLILRSSGRAGAAPRRDAVLTMLLWLAWCCLLLLAASYFSMPRRWQWLFPDTHAQDRAQVLRLALLCCIFAVVICGLFVLRMRVDRWRFSGRDRRRSVPIPDDEMLAADFGTTAAQLRDWKQARHLVVRHAEDGSLAAVTALDAPPEAVVLPYPRGRPSAA